MSDETIPHGGEGKYDDERRTDTVYVRFDNGFMDDATVDELYETERACIVNELKEIDVREKRRAENVTENRDAERKLRERLEALG